MNLAQQAYKQYRQTRVNTASQKELLLMLFDAVVKEGNLAIAAIKQGAADQANRSLIKAQDIVMELMSSLDFNADFAPQLYQLYEYCHHLLVEANVRKSLPEAEQAVNLLAELRSTWYEVAKMQGELAAKQEVESAATAANGGGIELAR